MPAWVRPRGATWAQLLQTPGADLGGRAAAAQGAPSASWQCPTCPEGCSPLWSVGGRQLVGGPVRVRLWNVLEEVSSRLVLAGCPLLFSSPLGLLSQRSGLQQRSERPRATMPLALQPPQESWWALLRRNQTGH